MSVEDLTELFEGAREIQKDAQMVDQSMKKMLEAKTEDIFKEVEKRFQPWLQAALKEHGLDRFMPDKPSSEAQKV
jgi:hypothetical protein